MLKLNNTTLTQEYIIINSSSYKLDLDLSDVVNYDIFGIIKFSDGSERVIQFTPLATQKIYRAKLNIAEEDLHLLANIKLKLLLVDGDMKSLTNEISLAVDMSSIKNDIKISSSKEIKDLKLKVAELDKTIFNLLSGKILQNISVVNTGYIEKGMIPVAIDNKGNFIACYPFESCVKEVNGHEAEDGKVNLNSNDINYKQDKSVYDIISNVVEAIKALNESVVTLTTQQNEIRNKLNQLDLDFETYKNNGIV